jgi:hypothetical protein
MLARLSTRAPRAFNAAAVRFNSSAARTSRLAEMAASAEKPGAFLLLPSQPSTFDPATLADVQKKRVTNAPQAPPKSLSRCCGALSPSRLS